MNVVIKLFGGLGGLGGLLSSANPYARLLEEAERAGMAGGLNALVPGFLGASAPFIRLQDLVGQRGQFDSLFAQRFRSALICSGRRRRASKPTRR